MERKHSPDAIEHWNQKMISRHPDTAAKRADLSFPEKSRRPPVAKILRLFNLIEFGEGRLK